MPKKIVPEMRRTETLETCVQQMPECNLSQTDVERVAQH